MLLTNWAKRTKKPYLKGCGCGGIWTHEANAVELESTPFDRSGTQPNQETYGFPNPSLDLG